MCLHCRSGTRLSGLQTLYELGSTIRRESGILVDVGSTVTDLGSSYPGVPYHEGVDIAGAVGDPILAVLNGLVTATGANAGDQRCGLGVVIHWRFGGRFIRYCLVQREQMDAHERATSCWYQVAGLLRRKELAIEIIEAEIRSAMREVWLEASRLVLAPGEPLEIARKMRDRAEPIKPE